MKKTNDNYSQNERKDYNRHYYPNNKERIQAQRKTPLAVHRRKLNRLKHHFEAQISALVDNYVKEIGLLHSVLTIAQFTQDLEVTGESTIEHADSERQHAYESQNQ